MRTAGCAAALLLASGLGAQVATEANSGYRTEKQRAGMGKGLGSEDRDKRQKPRELIAEMKIAPGMAVADVGTGVGYMLPFLSEAVGPSGKVIAEDIFDDFLAAARERAKDLKQVEFVKGSETDAMLPENSFDRVLLLDVYHHFDYPEKMLAGIRKSLRPGGRLVLVEYYKREKAMPNGRALKHVRIDQAEVIREVEANGFRLESQWEHIPGSQYGLVLEKTP
jgi:ubiquinone/menaquinone biosynthesis C-methylase UbiE